MAIAYRTIRRLKDTFEYTRPYDDLIQQQQQIIGRRVLSTKKIVYLPPNPDGNYNMNFNQIPLPPPLISSLIIKPQQINNTDHDIQQSKLKNILIDELKRFFDARNQNNRQKNDVINSETNTHLQTSVLTQEYPNEQKKHVNPVSLKKQIIQRTLNSEQVKLTQEQFTDDIICKTIQHPERLLSISSYFPTANTTLLASISLLMSIFLSSDYIRPSKKFSSSLNLLNDILFYSTSFTFGCFGARWFKQTKPSHIHQFGNMLTRSLLLHTFLTSLRSDKTFPQQTFIIPPSIKTLSKNLFFTRQDMLMRIITSILHLIAGFTINVHDKNNI